MEPATASRRTGTPSPCCSPASGMLHHMTHLHPAGLTTIPHHQSKNRPRASRPPVARPWPMPAPKAAMPSPSPPASAMRPLHHDPPPPSVATSARAGFAVRKTPTATNVPPIRFIPALLFRPPALPSSPLILFRSRRDGGRTLHSVVVTHGERDVDRAQHGEDEGLHHGDECPEAVERDRDADLREAGEDLHHLVVRHHVGEQPDAERHGPEDVG